LEPTSKHNGIQLHGCRDQGLKKRETLREAGFY